MLAQSFETIMKAIWWTLNNAREREGWDEIRFQGKMNGHKFLKKLCLLAVPLLAPNWNYFDSANNETGGDT